MKRLSASGGPGSNQYATKPGGQTAVVEPHTRRQMVDAIADDLDPEDVAWQFDPRAAAWRDSGFSTQEIRAWLENGIDDPEWAKEWADRGVDALLAARWIQTNRRADFAYNFISWGVTDPEEAFAWERIGFRSAVVKSYLAQGLDPDRVDRWWSAAGITNGAIRDAWAEYMGVHDPFEAAVWERLGVRPNAEHPPLDAKFTAAVFDPAWESIGVTQPAPWVVWVLPPQEVARWRDLAVSCRPAEASESQLAALVQHWREQGYQPEDETAARADTKISSDW